MSDPAALPRHSTLDDVQGIGLGVFMCGLAIHVLTHAGLITGQTAGIAVILSYLSGWSFGVTFFAVNLPFYALAWRRFGPAFTARSALSVTLLSAVTMILPDYLSIARLDTWLAALIYGCLSGVGLLALFRHNGSLGGVGMLALLVQDRTRFRAGHVQMAVDAVIFAVAFGLFPAVTVLWSMLGALTLNLIITFNHRRDRYVAT